jgi:chaperonin GroEL
MFIGKLGRLRSFLIMPRGYEALHIPSDLVGITPATYESNRSDNNMQAALGAACNQVRRAIQQLGPIAGATKILAVPDPSELVFKGLQRGAQFIARAIGPHGLAMAVTLGESTQVVTRSGSSIAKGISADGFEAYGVREIREVTQEMDDAIGDGAKIAAVITAAMVEHGRNAISSGELPRDVADGLRRGVNEAKSFLEETTTLLGEKADVVAVATTAASSRAIGSLVADAMQAVGADGVITVYEATEEIARVETLEGVEFDRGMISRHFVTDPVKMEAVLEDAYILIHDRKITSMRELLPVLERVAQQGRPLLIIADDVEGEALATLVVNSQRGILRLVAVRGPSSGERRQSLLEDIAILTGGQVVSAETGFFLENT